MPLLSPEQNRALARIGLAPEQFHDFAKGQVVVFEFSTESVPGIGIVQIVGLKLRCGIFQIKDPGGGVKSLLRFRNSANDLAKAFGANELELFGAAIVNERLEQLLLRQAFVRRTVPCPDDLGGGEVEILSKVWPV
jgi:hypothetical protein